MHRSVRRPGVCIFIKPACRCWYRWSMAHTLENCCKELSVVTLAWVTWWFRRALHGDAWAFCVMWERLVLQDQKPQGQMVTFKYFVRGWFLNYGPKACKIWGLVQMVWRPRTSPACLAYSLTLCSAGTPQTKEDPLAQGLQGLVSEALGYRTALVESCPFFALSHFQTGKRERKKNRFLWCFIGIIF